MTIFDFIDYRFFLRKFIQQLPKKGRGEINRMAKSMQIHPSLVSQVHTYQKHLNLEQGQNLSLYLCVSNDPLLLSFVLTVIGASAHSNATTNFQTMS